MLVQFILKLSITRYSNELTRCSSSVDDISRRAQDLVEKINESRTSDQKVMEDFQGQLMEKVAELCSWNCSPLDACQLFNASPSSVSISQTALISHSRSPSCVSRWKRTCSQCTRTTATRCSWSCRSWQRCWRAAISLLRSWWRPARPWQVWEQAWPIAPCWNPND